MRCRISGNLEQGRKILHMMLGCSKDDRLMRGHDTTVGPVFALLLVVSLDGVFIFIFLDSCKSLLINRNLDDLFKETQKRGFLVRWLYREKCHP